MPDETLADGRRKLVMAELIRIRLVRLSVCGTEERGIPPRWFELPGPPLGVPAGCVRWVCPLGVHRVSTDR